MRPSSTASRRQTPLVTVDVTLFTLKDDRLHLFLVRRDNDPYEGRLALPGGYVHTDDDADTTQTARRIIAGKLGVPVPAYLEQLYTFSGPVRDPRGWSVAVAYMAVLPAADAADALSRLKPTDDETRSGEATGKRATGETVALVAVDELPPLPFDHDRIVQKALQRLRGKATYSSLPAFLLPDGFTVNELRDAYEQVLGAPLQRSTFRRRILEQDMIEEIPGVLRQGNQRPAQVYRLTSSALKEFERTI